MNQNHFKEEKWSIIRKFGSFEESTNRKQKEIRESLTRSTFQSCQNNNDV